MNKYNDKMTNRKKDKEKNLMGRIKGCKETASRKEGQDVRTQVVTSDERRGKILWEVNIESTLI